MYIYYTAIYLLAVTVISLLLLYLQALMKIKIMWHLEMFLKSQLSIQLDKDYVEAHLGASSSP